MNQKPLDDSFARYFLMLILLALSLLLTACGGGNSGAILSGTPGEAGQLDLSSGTNDQAGLTIGYHIGQNARVSALIAGPDGQQYSLRQNEERTPGDYELHFNGAVSLNENGLEQTRLLANGAYRYILKAAGSDGNTGQAEGAFKVVGSPTDAAPRIDALKADPAVISPNFDAREDTSVLNWRTSQPATVTISISGPDNFSKIIKTVKNAPAQEDKAVFDGLDQKNLPLPDGTYTYTVQAADKWGNVTRRASTIEIKGGGKPSASIVQATIGPTAILQGGYVTVTLRVKNTGKVPIRSQGPGSGYVYSSNDVYSSIEGGRYKDAAGFWRVGVDFESNSGGAGAVRYPWRWGFGDELQPGHEAEVVGVIKIEQQVQQLKLYAGLIEEQVALPQDHIQVTTVNINY